MSVNRDIFSISRLNNELRHAIEGSFPLLWVQGEISNLAQPRSGHLYFSLKDEQAQIRCAMFRNRRNLLRFNPANGEQVLARAKVAFYEPRGECQLVIEHLEPAGAGALQQAFEALKAKLQAEGLFDAERKQELPAFPQCIGVISSPSGAALRDVLQVLGRRYPLARVILYPSAVQGAAAAGELKQAVELAAQRQEADVLILTRGGGSIEDLAAFNDEALARTITTCPIPLVSAVGHEIDFTIADFVADRRAPTPSAAAELVSPDSAALFKLLANQENRLATAMQRQLVKQQILLQQVQARLLRCHPGARLRQQQQRLDELQLRLSRQIERQLEASRKHLQHLRQRVSAHNPADRLRAMAQQRAQLDKRLQDAMQRKLTRSRQKLEAWMRELNAVSPLATLQRGYSIALNQQGKVIRSVKQLRKDQQIELRLADGQAKATILSKKKLARS